MRYELSDFEWIAIKPMLPNKMRGVRRVNDRRVLNGIFWVLRSGAPWRDLPENYGSYTTCYNRFVRWRKAGIWDQIMEALAAGHDAAVQMIDTSVVNYGITVTVHAIAPHCSRTERPDRVEMIRQYHHCIGAGRITPRRVSRNARRNASICCVNKCSLRSARLTVKKKLPPATKLRR